MTAIRRRSLQVDDPLSSTTDQARDPGSTFGAAVGGRLREIPVEQISANPGQPRKRFEEESLASLADSIREWGVLQPIIVRPSGQGYELVAGERRWRAAQLAGQSTVPALVDLNLDQAESLELALIENIAREDLTPIEQARTLATLLEDLRLTSSVLAKRLGRSRSDIANTVRLLELPDEAIALVDSGELSKGHGKVLLTEPDHGRRRDLARRAVQGGWSVRALETEIAQAAAPPPARRASQTNQSAATAELEDAIADATGGQVRATHTRQGFMVTLDQVAARRLAEILVQETTT